MPTMVLELTGLDGYHLVVKQTPLVVVLANDDVVAGLCVRVLALMTNDGPHLKDLVVDNNRPVDVQTNKRLHLHWLPRLLVEGGAVRLDHKVLGKALEISLHHQLLLTASWALVVANAGL